MSINRHYSKVTEYFNDKASDYDEVDNQIYWVLSDEFYKHVLQDSLSDFISNKKSIKLLDAGAGTGRWTLFMHELFEEHKEKFSGLLVDISTKMLDEAERKISAKGLTQVYKTQIGNIEDMNTVEDNTYDICISFYNVLSFTEYPEKAVSTIYKKLKKGGIHISVVGNKYHALFFSILTGRLKEIDNVMNNSKIAFNDLMPSMHCFTPDDLKDLYIGSGFKSVTVRGGPNFIYPGMEETFLKGETAAIKDKLKNQDVLQKILQTEVAMYDNDDVVGRGNTLIAIATK